MKPQFYTRQKVDELLNGVGGKVVSVNGKDGEVVLTGNNINLDDDPDGSKTLAEAIASAAFDADSASKAAAEAKATAKEAKDGLADKLDTTGDGEINGSLRVDNTLYVNGEVKTMWVEIQDLASGEVSAYGGHDDDEAACIHIKTNADRERELPEGDIKIPRKKGTAATIEDVKLTPVYAWTFTSDEFDASKVSVNRVTEETYPSTPPRKVFEVYFDYDGDGRVASLQLWDELAPGDYEISLYSSGAPKSGVAHLSIDHYTTANGKELLAGTKAALFAGAVISSTSTTLKNRDCAVVAFDSTNGTEITFEAMSGLRSFELLLTGFTDGGRFVYPTEGYTYRGDADSLTPEAGDNHFTFAEYAPNCFFVTRHLAPTI